MSRPLAHRATVEELAVLRDQGRAVELVDGEIVEKAMPQPEHGAETANLRILDAGVGDVVRAEPFEATELSVAELFGRDE